MLMSFLGSIGILMRGSGLVEALETCYGSHTIANMMTGKLLARTVRGHFLVSEALMRILLEIFIPQSATLDLTATDQN